MIDEFASLRKMDIFADALSYMAGFGLKAYLITQTFGRLLTSMGPTKALSAIAPCG